MYTEIRWQQRFQNFEKAYYRLDSAIKRFQKTPKDELILEGLVQTYEFTYELGWKTLKDYLEEEGYSEAKSPKSVIRLALKEGYVTSDLWMMAIKDRNLTTHTYNEEIAQSVVANICNDYFFLLRDLYFTLKKEHPNE